MPRSIGSEQRGSYSTATRNDWVEKAILAGICALLSAAVSYMRDVANDVGVIKIQNAVFAREMIRVSEAVHVIPDLELKIAQLETWSKPR